MLLSVLLNSLLDVSAMYTRTVGTIRPSPSPPIPLLRSNNGKLWEHPNRILDATKGIAEKMIIFFLPNKSESHPPSIQPTIPANAKLEAKKK